jgi:hypothetical protein
MLEEAETAPNSCFITVVWRLFFWPRKSGKTGRRFNQFLIGKQQNSLGKVC